MVGKNVHFIQALSRTDVSKRDSGRHRTRQAFCRAIVERSVQSSRCECELRDPTTYETPVYIFTGKWYIFRRSIGHQTDGKAGHWRKYCPNSVRMCTLRHTRPQIIRLSRFKGGGENVGDRLECRVGTPGNTNQLHFAGVY